MASQVTGADGKRSDWNPALRAIVALTLTASEQRLAMVLVTQTCGYYRREAKVGQDLLRREARLDGRNFGRAVARLQTLGLLRVTPGKRGRGHRSTYELIFDREETEPAPDTEPVQNTTATKPLAVSGPASRTSKKRNAVQAAKASPTLQAQAIDAFRSHGGNLEYGQSRVALAAQVKQLTKRGVSDDVILAAAAELGRQHGFGGLLKQTADYLIERGGPCMWDGRRSGVDPRYLRECGCAGCIEWAEVLEPAGVAA